MKNAKVRGQHSWKNYFGHPSFKDRMRALSLLRNELNSNLTFLMNSLAAFDEALFSQHSHYRTVVIRKKYNSKDSCNNCSNKYNGYDRLDMKPL